MFMFHVEGKPGWFQELTKVDGPNKSSIRHEQRITEMNYCCFHCHQNMTAGQSRWPKENHVDYFEHFSHAFTVVWGPVMRRLQSKLQAEWKPTIWSKNNTNFQVHWVSMNTIRRILDVHLAIWITFVRPKMNWTGGHSCLAHIYN